MLKSFEDIKNNIRDIYYQITCAIENDIINTSYPITIWLSDDYYCIYNYSYDYIIPDGFKMRYANIYIFNKSYNIKIRHSVNIDKTYDISQHNINFNFKLFKCEYSYNDTIHHGFYSLSPVNTNQHKLYIKDISLFTSIFGSLIHECELYKNKYINSDLQIYNNYKEYVIFQFNPINSNTLFNDIIIYNKHINEEYILYTKKEFIKTKNKFISIVKHTLDKLDLVLDQDIKTNIKMYNCHYDITNDDFLFAGISHLNKKLYFIYNG